MPANVLTVLSSDTEVEFLTTFFNKRGIGVTNLETAGQIITLSKRNKDFIPDLVILDLQLPTDIWLSAFQEVGKQYPEARLLFVTDHSEPNLILRAKGYGAKHFLRGPFDEAGLRFALQRMSSQPSSKERVAIQESFPKVRIPVRVKIIFPYIFLALVIALGAAFAVSQVTRDTVEERFVNQLIDTGKLGADWMVREEDRLLSSLRLLLNTQGMPEAVFLEDAERLRLLALPVAINAGEEVIEILNKGGISVLTIRREPGSALDSYQYAQGENYLGLGFVQDVLAGLVDSLGDKYVGLIENSLGTYFYVSGPIFDSIGNPVGVILVGNSVETITRQMREDTLAHISIYNFDGQLISSTLLNLEENPVPVPPELVAEVLTNKDEGSTIRGLSSDSVDYREIIGSWEARSGQELGVMGIALPETFLVRASEGTSIQIFLFVSISLLFVIGSGVIIANRITKPLLQVVDASTEIAHGNINVKVEAKGSDEIAILAHSFNRMVEGLKEGSLYRDILGRTVSPEVRDQLRDTLASGDIRLEGQFAMATVLMADIQGYTTISEKEDPSTVFKWLNELFGELVPIVTSHDGVVNEFSGDSMFTFFGILPRPMDGAESAYLACLAAVEMLSAIERINVQREKRGDPPLNVGIGVNTGPVTAGGLGAEDRLHYTIIGDTVNTAQRIEGLAHQFGESGIMVGKQTLIALWDKRDKFNLEAKGVYTVKGKEEKLLVYRLWPSGVGAKPDIEMVDLVQ